MSEEYWNEQYWKKYLKEHEGEKLDFVDDIWVTEYSDIFDNIPRGKALDLGCGIGQFTKFMLDNGFNVVSADISAEALGRLKKAFPSVEVVQLDMSEKLPFNDGKFELVIANLSIHYFDEKTTEQLMSEIKRILKPGGYFIGSVNSAKGFEFIKGKVEKLEENYYSEGNGREVRLWDKEQFDRFFKDFEKIVLEEVRITRWNRPKDMSEFIYKSK